MAIISTVPHLTSAGGISPINRRTLGERNSILSRVVFSLVSIDSGPKFKLIFNKIIICSTESGQRFMITGLDNTTAVNHNYPVGIADGRQAVSDDNHRASSVKTGEVVHNLALIGGIERVGSLVKKDKVGIFIEALAINIRCF